MNTKICSLSYVDFFLGAMFGCAGLQVSFYEHCKGCGEAIEFDLYS